MEYSIYCLLCALAVVVSCTRMMTRKLRCYQYLVLILYIFLVMYLGWGRMGQLVTFFCVGGTVLISCRFMREYMVGNICLGLCGHLLNSALNSSLLWALGMLRPDMLNAVSDKYMLAFSGAWILVLLLMTKLYRYFLYTRWNVKKYFSLSPQIQGGVLAEILLFSILFVINITMGQKAGYSVRALGLNSGILLCSLFVNLILFLYLGNVIRSEEEKRADELKYQALQSYTESLNELYDDIRTLRHDYKNVMCSAAGYIREGDMEGLRKYFDKELLPIAARQSEKNSVSGALSNLWPLELRSFLYEKCLSASVRNVEIRCEAARKLEVSGMKPLDLVRVLGIYLDNAIEAAELSEEKKVWVLFIQEENGILIRIENTYGGERPELARLEQEGYSTKGAGRGLGLYSARRILRTYPEVTSETVIEKKIFRQSLYL